MRFRSFLAAVVLSGTQLGATNILDFASISRSQNYTQIGAAQPVNAQYQSSSQVRILNFGDFNSASMKVPGGVPVGMPVLDSFNFTYTSASARRHSASPVLWEVAGQHQPHCKAKS